MYNKEQNKDDVRTKKPERRDIRQETVEKAGMQKGHKEPRCCGAPAPEEREDYSQQ
jgi:hypothetical protein